MGYQEPRRITHLGREQLCRPEDIGELNTAVRERNVLRRLTLPDIKPRSQLKDTSELNTIPLSNIPQSLFWRSQHMRRTVLVPYSGEEEVVSRDLAESLSFREKVSNMETMRLQAPVIEQDRTCIPITLPLISPVDTVPITTLPPLYTPPSPAHPTQQRVIQRPHPRQVNQINIKNVYLHIMTDPLYKNSILNMASTFILGGLGFVFWIIIARLYKPEDVGIAVTLISIMTLLSSFTIMGLSSSLNRYLPKSTNKNELINSTFIIVALVTLLASAIFFGVLQIFSPQLVFLRSNFFYFISFTLFVIFNSWNILVESTFMAFRAAGNILIKNSIIGVTKLLLPFAFVIFGAYGIFASTASGFALGVLASLIILVLNFKFRPSISVNFSVIKKSSTYSFANYIAAFMSSMPSLILPVILLNVLSAKYVAFYFVALMIQSILQIIPAATAQSLLTEGSYNEADLKKHVKKAMVTTLVILVPAITVIVLGGNVVLQLFGKNYASGALLFLQIFCASTLFAALVSISNAIMNIKQQIKSLVFLNSIEALLTLLLSCAFISGGLVSIGWGWMLGQTIAGLVALFLIIRNLYG